MKLRNKMFLVLGGTTFLVTVLIITLSLCFFSSSIKRIEQESSRLAAEQVSSSLKLSMHFLQDTANLYLTRISSFFGTTQGDELQPLLNARFQHAAGSDILVFCNITKSQGGKCNFSSVLVFRDVKGNRKVVELSGEKPVFLDSRELHDFLFQEGQHGKTAFLVYDGQCWIVNKEWQTETSGRMLAVRIDKKYIYGAEYHNHAGLRIYRGDKLLFDTCRTVLNPPDEITGQLDRMTVDNPDLPQVKIIHGQGKDEKWLAAAVELNQCTADAAGNRIRIMRLYNLSGMVPHLHGLLKQEFESLFILVVLLAAAGFLVLLLLPIRLTREIADPLSVAVNFADTLANGSFPPVTEVHCGIAEVDRLMKALNHMRDRLNNQISKLKRSHGRELIARQDAETSNRLKVDFLNSMSSEYRENLNSISGFLGFMTSQTEEGGKNIRQDDLIRLCEAMKNNILILQEIGRIMHELVILDDPEEAAPKPSDCDFYQILRDVNEPFSSVAAERKIMVEFHFASDTPAHCFLDIEKFTRMLMQITKTLLNSTPEGSRIELYSKPEKGRLKVGVTGSADNAIPLEFILYHTARRPLSHFQSALGVIDLTIARQIAHQLGGEMDISCQDEGSYRIELSFPLADLVRGNMSDTTRFLLHARHTEFRNSFTASAGINRKEIFESVKRRKATGAAPLKVLLAEDDESNRMLLHMMLRDAHCETADACDTVAILEQLHITAFDVLILNLHMPSLDRFPFLQKLRQISNNPNLYIIVVSAFLEDGDRERLISAGANQCLLSPIARDELIGAIQNAGYAHLRHKNNV